MWTSPQVLVVGAGPTGLLLAAELERRGVACLLVDALDAPRTWDRATVVHARSMEILEALGLEHHLLDTGVRTRAARFHSGGVVLGELHFDQSGSRYDFDIGISEEVTEAVLTAHLEAVGGAVTRATRLVGLVPGEDAVTATLERDGGRRELVVDWVVGCDGLRSAVRAAAGIAFAGSDGDARWAVFDASVAGWPDPLDVVSVHFAEPMVILTPLPGARWRVYLRPTSDDGDLVAEAAAVLARHAPGASFTDVERPARFHCPSRIAERFRAGRLLVAGDAAHACTPSEGHGMNTGLQDAFNLGWKLALVCRGAAGPGLLDTYEAERRPVAERIVASGLDVEAAQALTAADDRAARDAAIRVTFADADTAHHEAAAAAEVDREYPRSRAVAGDDGPGAQPGRRLPETADVEPAGGAPRSLHALAAPDRCTLLVLGGPQADVSRVGALTAALRERAHPAVSAVVALASAADEAAMRGATAADGAAIDAPPGTAMRGATAADGAAIGAPPSAAGRGPTAAEGPAVGGPAPTDGARVGRMSRALAAELGVTAVTVLAVRPDRYVGLRDDTGDPAVVGAWLDGLVA